MKRFGLGLLIALALVDCGGGDGGGPPVITAVNVSGDSTVILAGTRQLSASAMAGSTPVSTGVTFQWTSSADTIASVNASGLVTGIKRGSVTITARAVLNGTPTTVTGTRAIRARIGTIDLAPTAPAFASLGDTVVITAQGRDALNAAVPGITFAFLSRATGVVSTSATSASQADLVAGSNGRVSIVVSGDGVSDSVIATVRQVAVSLSLTPDTTTFDRVGRIVTPVVTGVDARGNALQSSAPHWLSQDTAVAKVDTTTGAITSRGAGQTRVIASSGSVADTVRVGVDQIPATIDITPAANLAGTPELRTVQTVPFYAVVRDSAGFVAPLETVTWSVHTGVVSVNPTTGLVTTSASTGPDTVTATAAPTSGSRAVVVSATPVSYSTNVSGVLVTTCVSVGCHNAASQLAGLNLEAASSYGELVDVASSEVPGLRRVRPFRPDSSFLVHKIQGTQSVGLKMPEGCPGTRPCLPNATIDIIRNWILQGAQNN
jgi:hypothetical protein